MIIAVTGLRREARIIESEGVRAIACGGRPDVLQQQLDCVLDDRVRGVISFGICAGLSPDLRAGSCIIATEIIAADQRIPVDAEWSSRLRTRLAGAARGAIAGTSLLLRDANQKSALAARTGALGADMESHIAAEAAQRRNLPFVCVRSVCDEANSDLPDAAIAAVAQDGSINAAAVLQSILRHPAQLAALARTAKQSRTAFDALLRCRRLLGSRLGAPDFGELALDMA